MSRVLYLLLAVVASAAAVLSFDALLGLALLCGFRPVLAPLLPLTIDAGAAAGSLVWLTRPVGRARSFGRVLALVLLAGSVAGNALGHGLVAYGAPPHWWVVVAVSAVPPAVLGAVVHLAVLARRPAASWSSSQDLQLGAGDSSTKLQLDPDEEEAEPPRDWWATAPPAETDRVGELIAAGVGRRRLARELAISEHAARELLDERRNGQAVPS